MQGFSGSKSLELAKILEEIGSGGDKNRNILFIATTNYLEVLDPAATRIGRFGRTIEVKADRSNYSDLIKVSLKANGIDDSLMISSVIEDSLKTMDQDGNKPFSGVEIAEFIKQFSLVYRKGIGKSKLNGLIRQKLNNTILLNRKQRGFSYCKDFSYIYDQKKPINSQDCSRLPACAA